MFLLGIVRRGLGMKDGAREALAEAPFPLSPQQFWDRFWADDSTFPHDFARTCGDQDCFVGLWKWQPAGAGGAANEAGGLGHRLA